MNGAAEKEEMRQVPDQLNLLEIVVKQLVETRKAFETHLATVLQEECPAVKEGPEAQGGLVPLANGVASIRGSIEQEVVFLDDILKRLEL